MSDFITVTTFRKLPSYQNRKEFNSPVIETNLAERPENGILRAKQARGTPSRVSLSDLLGKAQRRCPQGNKPAVATYGWYSVAVSIKACGALGPGSIPGTGLFGD